MELVWFALWPLSSTSLCNRVELWPHKLLKKEAPTGVRVDVVDLWTTSQGQQAWPVMKSFALLSTIWRQVRHRGASIKHVPCPGDNIAKDASASSLQSASATRLWNGARSAPNGKLFTAHITSFTTSNDTQIWHHQAISDQYGKQSSTFCF